MQLGRLESTWKGKDIKITMMAQTITFEIRMCMVALVHISYITLKADVVGVIHLRPTKFLGDRLSLT